MQEKREDPGKNSREKAGTKLPPIVTPTPPVDPLAAQGLTRLSGAFIISGNTGSALYLEQVIDGQQALVKPGLWRHADGRIVLSLPELAKCLGWQLMGSAADGLYTLHACGYTVTVLLPGGNPIVAVDGATLPVADGDAFLSGGTLYVSHRFLEQVLGASTVFDVDENSLVLFLTEKSMALAQD